MGVLLLASKSDTASMTLFDAIMRLKGWSEVFTRTYGDYYIHECGSVYLLLIEQIHIRADGIDSCLLYTSPSPRDRTRSRMPSSA